MILTSNFIRRCPSVTFFNKLLLRWRCRRSHLLWNGSEGSKEQLQTQLSLVSLEVDFSTFLLCNPVSLELPRLKTHPYFYAKFIQGIATHQKGHGGFAWAFCYLFKMNDEWEWHAQAHLDILLNI